MQGSLSPPQPESERKPDLRSPATGAGTSIHWPSAWQFSLGLLASLSLWGLALILLALGVIEIISPTSPAGATPLFLLSTGLLFFGVLILPSVGYAYGRLFDRPFNLPDWMDLGSINRAVLLLPLAIAAGHWISAQPQVAPFLLPPLHVMALSLPIVWLFWQGSQRLRLKEPQQAWGIFGLGLVVGPALILFLEVLAGGVILLMGAYYISSNPTLVAELQDLLAVLRSPEQNITVAVNFLEPYLTHPAVSYTIFAFVAGMVPIIEEAIKPIGVWLLPGATSTPAKGFVAGLLSGAGYALFENLALSSQADAWALAVTARAGTSILHMTTAGLMGWGLVLAWRWGKYRRLLLVYLISVLIHGLWNGFTLLTITNFLEFPETPLSGLLNSLGLAAPVILGGLTVTALVILITTNRRFRPAHKPTPLP